MKFSNAAYWQQNPQSLQGDRIELYNVDNLLCETLTLSSARQAIAEKQCYAVNEIAIQKCEKEIPIFIRCMLTRRIGKLNGFRTKFFIDGSLREMIPVDFENNEGIVWFSKNEIEILNVFDRWEGIPLL